MNDQHPIRVFLVDDHAIVRTGIAGMLADAAAIKVVGQAADGVAALDGIREHGPDVVLMDLRMPRLDGPSTIARMRDDGDSRGVLVITTYDTDADIVRAIEASANGYLLKDASRDELVQAIEAVARGESWLTPSVATRLMGQMRKAAGENLSEREIDVIRLVAKGHSNKEIAAQMHISQATVKTHLIHIFRKLDVNDRTAAVTVALERGVIAI
jgi:DNA-binding NarL/FixJ family response regulator